MKYRALSLLVLFIAVVLLAPAPSDAGWQPGGAPASRAIRRQENCVAVTDGAGGAIIIWEDTRESYIYAQRIDHMGNAMWDVDGIPVVIADNSRADPRAVSDGTGGAFIVWSDFRSGLDDDIYVQHLDHDGNRLMGSFGFVVCAAVSNQMKACIASDNLGGCYIAWEDNRGSSYDIYAQRFAPNGTAYWAADGIPVCTATDSQTYPAIANDGGDSAIISWADRRNGVDDNIYAQRLKIDGSIAWSADGIAVCVESSTQFLSAIEPDGQGNAYICWLDARNPPGYDIYAQRIDAGGNMLWATDGKSLVNATGDQQGFDLLADGAGGFYIAWSDDRNGGIKDIYAQRWDPAGVNYWEFDGIPICVAANYQYQSGLVPHGEGGVIVVWDDLRSGDFEAYAQSVDPYGAIRWTVNGIQASGADGSHYQPKAVPDGAGGAIVVWEDYRSAYPDIYAQRIDMDGNWGVPEPRIRAVRDVPGDQGGQVNIAWDASQYDPGVSLITAYSVWRSIEPEAAMMLIKDGARLLENAAEIELPDDLDVDLDIVRMSLYGASEYYWTLVGSHDAFYLESYSLPTETLFDSTAVSDEHHYFQVIAHTAAPTVFYVSEPDSGYSVDNIAPCLPLALAGEQSFAPEGLELSWSPNTEPDLDCYHIYRGTSPNFDPSQNNLLTEQCDTLLFDGGWSWDAGFCYKVAAVDIHGNESDYAVLCIEQVTGDDPMPLPDATFLSQNFPNPFNPATTIAFGLKESGLVKLSVYDAAGRLVRTLLNETRSTGNYEMTWNGLDNVGNQVSSGVYFYRLNAGEFIETRKMVLLR